MFPATVPRSRAGARAGRTRGARRLLAAALVGYALAALALVLWYGDREVYVDEGEYLATARHLAEEGVHSRNGDAPDALRPPGYAFALAPFALAGGSMAAARAAQLALLCAALVALARSRAAALPAGVPDGDDARDLRAALLLGLVAASPVIPYTAALLFPQVLLAALLVGVLLWTLRPGVVHGPRSAVGTGLVCSYAVLCSPTVLTIAPVAAWTLGARSRRPLTCAVLVLAATLVLPAAWTVRNRVVLGEWIVLSNNVGSSLQGAWAGRGADAADAAPAPPTAGPSPAVPRGVGLTADAYLYRLRNFFESDNPLQTEREMSPGRELALAASYYGLLALVALRLLLARRAPLGAAERAALALYAATALFHAAVFVRVRYRVPFDVLLLLPAANALLVVGFAALRSRR